MAAALSQQSYDVKIYTTCTPARVHRTAVALLFSCSGYLTVNLTVTSVKGADWKIFWALIWALLVFDEIDLRLSLVRWSHWSQRNTVRMDQQSADIILKETDELDFSAQSVLKVTVIVGICVLFSWSIWYWQSIAVLDNLYCMTMMTTASQLFQVCFISARP